MYDTFSILWLLWLVAFLVLEGLALYLSRKAKAPEEKNGTLSATVWSITNGNKLFMIIFVIFFGVLAYHFFIWK